jgi:hypothetical protein
MNGFVEAPGWELAGWGSNPGTRRPARRVGLGKSLFKK